MTASTSGRPGEKQGNTSWVECSCGAWFPASETLLDSGSVPLHCPSCHREFLPENAARIERVGTAGSQGQ